ncbi:MAG: hypothetical protein HOP29_04275 [Phycisphaerales bacterium]|nr:hypothetical protein [Phycisphaerales bacterium]
MAVWSVVKLSQMPPDLRIDAEYYRPEVLRLRRSVEGGRWPVETVEQLSDSVINFGAYSLCNDIAFQEFEEKDADAVEFITAQDIQDGFIDHANARWIPASQHSGLLWKSQVGTSQVLVAMAARLGHAAVYDGTSPLNSSQDIAKITVRDPEAFDPHYLAIYINSGLGRGLLLASQTGSVQQHTNLGRIKAIPVVMLHRRDQLRAAALYRSAVGKRKESAAIIAASEARLMKALGLDRLDLSPQKCYTRRFRDLEAEARFDAEYFNPKYQRIIKKLRAGGRALADVAPLAQRAFDPALRPKGSTFRYIEIGSLTGDGEAEAETLDVADAPSRAAWIVKPGDVMTSTVRPIRRLSALVRDDQDGCVCSSGFAVLSPASGADGIEPEVLLTYLRLPIICEILDLHCTASMYPAIPENRLMRIPIIVPDTKTRKAVVANVREAMTARSEAARLLEQAKKTVEDLITRGKPGGGE